MAFIVVINTYPLLYCVKALTGRTCIVCYTDHVILQEDVAAAETVASDGCVPVHSW